MADNTTLNPGAGGDVIRTIQRPTSKTQVLQVDIGGEASEQLVVGSMPVSGTVAVSAISGTVTTAGTSTVSGTVAVSSIANPVSVISTAALPPLQAQRFNFTGAQTDTALVTPAVNQRVFVSMVSIGTANTNSVDTSFRVGTGTTTTPTGLGCIFSHPGLAANASVSVGNGFGVLGSSALAADPLRFTCSTPTGGSIEVNISYYVA